jgi:DNA-binding winged helix-turn-helix (wHTH) protein
VATAPLPPLPPAAPASRVPSTRVAPGAAWLFGQYRLEPALRRLHAGDRACELDPRALAVLECLLRRAEQVVPRATLIAEAWPGAGTVFDSAVSKVMRRLRIALGDANGHVLQTIYGEGYRLALPAVLLPPPPAQAREAINGATDASPAPHAPVPGPDTAPTSVPGTAEQAPVAPAELARRGRGPWLARLPWIIATVATLVAAWLAWLLLRLPA